MNDFGNIIKKYSAPALFLIIAIIIAIIGITQKQPMIFNISALLMFIAAIFSFLFSSGKLRGQVLIILGIISGIAAMLVLFVVFRTIKISADFKRNFEQLETKSQFVLSDIRQIQKAYAEKNGAYATNFNELIDFVKNGKTFYVVAEGSVLFRPITVEERAYLYGDNRLLDKNMTELEAWRLSKMPNADPKLATFKRDTLEQSFYESKFNKSTYLDSRIKAGLGKFNIDSLAYIPESKKEWKLEVKNGVALGDEKINAIYVSGKLPYGEDKGKEGPVLFFGDKTLSSKNLGGSWEK